MTTTDLVDFAIGATFWVCACTVGALLVGCSGPCRDESREIGIISPSLRCQRGADLTIEQVGSSTFARCLCSKDGGR